MIVADTRQFDFEMAVLCWRGRASCDCILRVDVHPCKNETQPCIRLLFSRLNQIFRSSRRETVGLLTCELRIKEKILVR